jgi:low temperature requirement protein LtrA
LNGPVSDEGLVSDKGPVSDEGAVPGEGAVPEDGPVSGEAGGKRVSWAELYFDLIFAFAVSQPTHIMTADPRWDGFGRALGLFAVLWWTWIGFVVLCNRYGSDRIPERLFVLAGTLPCAVAAVQTHSAAAGHVTAFACALAGARLVLALAFAFMADGARGVVAGYGLSAAVFVASVFVPGPWRYVLWGFTLIQEGGFLLLRDGERSSGRRRIRGADRSGRVESMRAMLKPPADPAHRVDAGHLAERFGLMIMILLGEVVASVAASAVDLPDHNQRYWVGLLAGLVLAAALWWIYFTAAAPLSESVLRASGGNPILAYGLYAGGHLTPAFSVLAVAAGVSLAISGAASRTAAWLVIGGLAAFLMGSRVMYVGQPVRFPALRRLITVGLTLCLAFLEPVISAAGVVLVAAVWAAGIAADVTYRTPGRLQTITADPLSYFRAPAGPAPVRNGRAPDDPGPADPSPADPSPADPSPAELAPAEPASAQPTADEADKADEADEAARVDPGADHEVSS